MSGRRWLSAVVVALVVAGAVAGARAEQPVTRWFVDVPVDSPESVKALAAAGFDVAGVNRAAGLVGVVATAAELDRLRSLGVTYSVRGSNADTKAVTALSDYTDPQELSAVMDQIVAAHPDIAQKIALGESLFEGQRQYALKITKDVALPNTRPSFLMDAQHHAREVMTAEIARDMMDYLTSRYATDADVQRWVDNINIYIVPSVNPDGAMYVFQHDNMWRKNRRPTCQVDVNRNYPFMWAGCNGSSGDCADDTYRGFEGGSEPESQGLMSLTSDVRPFIALSYHSYGEYLMYSYGCTNPDEMTAMDEVARALNAILPNDSGVTGRYAVGPIWDTIYLVDGGSIDTQYARYGAYGFTIEVNSSSFQPDYATWRDITIERQRIAWRFFLDRTLDGPQIRGRVTDAVTGAPLSAQVSVQEVTFTHGESVRIADRRGLYHWLARPGQTYHLTFSSAGYCALTQAVTVGSGAAIFDPQLVRPTPPSDVSAAGNGDNRIDVSWSPTLNATAYRVLRSLASGGPYTEVALVTAPQTTYADTDVSGGVTYYYVVRSLQPCESTESREAAGSTTGSCTLAPGFAGLDSVTSATIPTCTLDLVWRPAIAYCGGPVYYEVHRSASAPFEPTPANLVASGLSGTTYKDHDALSYGSTYFYIVRAVGTVNGTIDGNTVTRSGNPTGTTTTGTWTDDAGDTGLAKLDLVAPWSVVPVGGRTAPAAYATGRYGNSACAAMTTPTITLQSGAVLSFASKYDIETGWDAGIVEIATGPAFDKWTRLTTVNYPDALANTGNACGFPVSGIHTVFSRNSGAPSYPASNYSGSLGAYAGTQVRLRWRLSSDITGNGAGWWVDDIAVTNAVFEDVCSSGLPATPREASPPGTPLLVARAVGTALDLSYTPGCGTLDNVVYWGASPLAGGVQWTNAACALGNTGRATFDPGDLSAGAMFYFVIVGQGAASEGSYGQRFDGSLWTERPEAVGVGACDRPQELGGSCP